MPAPDFDPSKLANKWVAYFDLLGFKQHVKQRGLIDAFGLLGWCSNDSSATNAAFNEYWVTINPTNRLVCEIRGESRKASSFFDVLTAVRQKYGNESSKGKMERFPAYTWWHGDRSLWLFSMGASFHLSCTDNTLNHPVKPSADTNGF